MNSNNSLQSKHEETKINEQMPQPFLFDFITESKGAIAGTTSGKWNDVDANDTDPHY